MPNVFKRLRRALQGGQPQPQMQIGMPIAANQIPMAFKYYRDPDHADETAGPGLRIEIPHGDPTFQAVTIRTLDAIHSTPTGRIIIETLVGSGRSVKIQKTATRGNSCDVGENGLNYVARELADPVTAKIGANTRAALVTAAPRVNERHNWLANAINNTPFYRLEGEPPQNGRYQHQNTITGEDVRSWCENNVPFGRGRAQDDEEHIANSIICALEADAVKGTGSDAAITFNADPNFVLNTERPMGIGLAHELIHAYWSIKGQQVGLVLDTPSTILFEHKCVGLGHWDNRDHPDHICENRIRGEWFANTADLFEESDHVNRSQPGRRNYYNKPKNST